MAGQIDLGSLLIYIRANDSQFKVAMDGAKKDMEDVGKKGHSAGQEIGKIGRVLIAEFLPGVDLSARELSKLLSIAQKGTGVFATLAQAGVLALGAGLGYAAGNAIRNFIDLQEAGFGVVESLKLAVGQTKSYVEVTKEAAEA